MQLIFRCSYITVLKRAKQVKQQLKIDTITTYHMAEYLRLDHEKILKMIK